MLHAIRNVLLVVCVSGTLFGQQPDLKSIKQGLQTLRQLPDVKRGGATRQLALEIRALPPSRDKVILADQLSHLATEGEDDMGVIQEVATTLSDALRETPITSKSGKPSEPYYQLAKLVRYEGVTSDMSDRQYAQSMDLLKTHDAEAEKVDFTLEGLNLNQLGVKKVTLSQLRGKIVLLNFWATWCPPCRAEMPDLQAIYDHFKDQLVVLSITDEDGIKVASFIGTAGYKYPILIDPSRKVASEFHIDGIPQSFVFDRDGKLVGHSEDMRTQRQFLAMLARAGLKQE
ncbi:MAG TPA: TlpA disulfide reductase family protein [Acidobacteriaceae bacterium]|jgi:thiol-disulfide isomerase/thioredoxin